MARAVTVYEAKTHLSRILDEVEAGSELIVTRNGVPCARIVPLAKVGRVPLGFVKGRVTSEFFEPLPEEELAAWEGRTRTRSRAPSTAKAPKRPKGSKRRR
jgi:prevent-host-death family protein